MSISGSKLPNSKFDAVDTTSLLDIDLENTADLDRDLSNKGAAAVCASKTVAEFKDTEMATGATGEFEGGMDKLLQRMRSDIMFELRSIQHGERPVTGQAHRDRLQQFMAKHINVEEKRHSGKENVPSNVDDVTEHRPEAVVVEVQGMVERRPVSSILQSAVFRRQLENVIRGSINSANRQLNTRPESSTHTTARTQRPSPAPRRHLTQPAVPVATETFAAPDLHRSESTESLESFSSAFSVVDGDIDIDEEEITNPAAEEHAHQIDNNLNFETGGAAEANRPRTPSDIPFEGLTWGDITRVHREELVQEISELLHSRLVSSTLDGEFRATLEVLTEERVAQSGANRQAVSEAIRRLPRSGIPRNDFTHLGIPPVEGDNWDNVSVTSVSAHSVPYVQTNTYLSREIQGLKTQMNEMKNMLKLTFDLQMDMQRAIRQEVAAALNRCSCHASSSGAQASPTRPVNETHCLICLDRHSDTVLYQCGHMCVCYICGQDLVSRGHNCPVCRAPIKDVIRAFKTNAE